MKVLLQLSRGEERTTKKHPQVTTSLMHVNLSLCYTSDKKEMSQVGPVAKKT